MSDADITWVRWCSPFHWTAVGALVVSYWPLRRWLATLAPTDGSMVREVAVY